MKVLDLLYPNFVASLFALKDKLTYSNKEIEATSSVEANQWDLENIQEFREEIRSRLISHQELLLEGNIKRAISCLELFKNQLNIHIAEENQIIIPLYKTRAPLPEKQRRIYERIYLGEHRKFLDLLDEVLGRLKEMNFGFVSKKSSDILHVLELENRFKQMLNRHDQREAKDLYLGAQYGMSEDQKKEVWNQIFQLRIEKGFRFGNEKTLNSSKIELVKQSWDIFKERFQEEAEKFAKETGKKLFLSDKEISQGLAPGVVEAKFIEDTIQSVEKMDGEEVNSIKRKYLADLELDERDELIGLLLNIFDRIKCGTLTPTIREAWSNVLNVTMNYKDVFLKEKIA